MKYIITILMALLNIILLPFGILYALGLIWVGTAEYFEVNK